MGFKYSEILECSLMNSGGLTRGTSGTLLSASSVSTAPMARRSSHKSLCRDNDPSHHSACEEEVRETSKLTVDQLKGHVFLNQYLVIKDIGRGTHGTVKLVYNTQDEMMYACKVVKYKRQRRANRLLSNKRSPSSLTMQEDELQTEIAVMKGLNHPNVVRLYEVIQDRDHEKLLMIMEYVEGGSVLSGHSVVDEELMFEPLPEAVALRYFRDIVKGLEYLHFNRIVHGDLKPDNLILTHAASVKISDFGSAKFLKSSSLVQGTSGTPFFFSPEMCSGGAFDGFEADVWALGVCLYVFVCGQVPFRPKPGQMVYDAIRHSLLCWPGGISLSVELRELLGSMLAKEPAERLSLEQVSCHPWFSQHGSLPAVQSSTQRLIASVYDTLQHSSLRNGVSVEAVPLRPVPADFKQLLPLAEERTYRDGQSIVTQGHTPEGLFVIIDGLLELYHMPRERKVVPDHDFADQLSDDSNGSVDEPLWFSMPQGSMCTSGDTSVRSISRRGEEDAAGPSTSSVRCTPQSRLFSMASLPTSLQRGSRSIPATVASGMEDLYGQPSGKKSNLCVVRDAELQGSSLAPRSSTSPEVLKGVDLSTDLPIAEPSPRRASVAVVRARRCSDGRLPRVSGPVPHSLAELLWSASTGPTSRSYTASSLTDLAKMSAGGFGEGSGFRMGLDGRDDERVSGDASKDCLGPLRPGRCARIQEVPSVPGPSLLSTPRPGYESSPMPNQLAQDISHRLAAGLAESGCSPSEGRWSVDKRPLCKSASAFGVPHSPPSSSTRGRTSGGSVSSNAHCFQAARNASAPLALLEFNAGAGIARSKDALGPLLLAGSLQHLNWEAAAARRSSNGDYTVLLEDMIPVVGPRKLQRFVSRTDSMHRRMKKMVDNANQCVVPRKRDGGGMEFAATRGVGSVVGELAVDGRLASSTVTAVAKGDVKVLFVKASMMSQTLLRDKPQLRATINRIQGASLVQAAMERFAEYAPEVVAAERIRSALTMSEGQWEHTHFSQ